MGETIHVPVKASHGYLGTIISYSHSDTLTLKHRIPKARGQYSMLRRSIHARRLVSQKYHARLWQAGVQSSLLYGVSARTGADKIRAFVSRQLRSIAGLPAHIVTKRTNTEVRDQLGIQEVLTTLQNEALKTETKLVDIHSSL